MKTDLHVHIIESCFFSYIDRGIGADETPLFTQMLDGHPLAAIIAEECKLPLYYAEAAIEIARQEVAL